MSFVFQGLFWLGCNQTFGVFLEGHIQIQSSPGNLATYPGEAPASKSEIFPFKESHSSALEEHCYFSWGSIWALFVTSQFFGGVHAVLGHPSWKPSPFRSSSLLKLTEVLLSFFLLHLVLCQGAHLSMPILLSSYRHPIPFCGALLPAWSLQFIDKLIRTGIKGFRTILSILEISKRLFKL